MGKKNKDDKDGISIPTLPPLPGPNSLVTRIDLSTGFPRIRMVNRPTRDRYECVCPVCLNPQSAYLTISPAGAYNTSCVRCGSKVTYGITQSAQTMCEAWQRALKIPAFTQQLYAAIAAAMPQDAEKPDEPAPAKQP